MADIQEKREKWKKEQARLRNLLRTTEPKGFLDGLQYVGGVDISFVKNTDRALACLSVLEYPSLKLVETFYHPCIMTEPYMPGFLGFREVDHLVEVVNMFLRKVPAAKGKFLIMVDGNGILHYRGFGSASHLGVVLDIPTIGVGKELLVVDGMDADYIAGQCQKELRKFGDQVDLIGPRTGRLYGRALRSKNQYEPIYVSIGHLISLEAAVDLVIKCCRNGALLPEPVRLADGLSRDVIIKDPRLSNYFDKKPQPKPQPPSSSSSSSSSKTGSSSSSSSTPSSASSSSSRSPPPPARTPTKHQQQTAAIFGKGAPSSEKSEDKGRGKRGALWECECGANNPIQRDICEFCYHARKAKPDLDSGVAKPSISGNEPAILGDAQRRKTTWKCRCGEQVPSEQVSCDVCHFINM